MIHTFFAKWKVPLPQKALGGPIEKFLIIIYYDVLKDYWIVVISLPEAPTKTPSWHALSQQGICHEAWKPLLSLVFHNRNGF